MQQAEQGKIPAGDTCGKAVTRAKTLCWKCASSCAPIVAGNSLRAYFDLTRPATLFHGARVNQHRPVFTCCKVYLTSTKEMQGGFAGNGFTILSSILMR